jgi:hypothetical protein
MQRFSFVDSSPTAPIAVLPEAGYTSLLLEHLNHRATVTSLGEERIVGNARIRGRRAVPFSILVAAKGETEK